MSQSAVAIASHANAVNRATRWLRWEQRAWIVGYVVSGWLWTRATTGAVSALVLASFLVTLLAPIFHWPDLLRRLSIFEQYGAPLVDDPRLSHVASLLAVAGAMVTAATWRFTRKDLLR